MNVVMISNYMNHHQISFCDEMDVLTNGHFGFVATEAMAQFRVKLGYRDMDHEKEYIIPSYENEEQYKKAQALCQKADVLIVGNVNSGFQLPKFKNKIVLFCSERLFKEDSAILKNCGRYIKYLLMHRRFRNSYLLCASAYAQRDYRLTGNFIGHAYKWGYFPPTKQYEIDALIEKKNAETAMVLWVGRLINWKHPEIAIDTAAYLRSNNCQFQMEIIGTGELENQIIERVKKEGLSDYVKILGSLPQETVREHMEKANIFLFTSDQNEGWGAVVNEAMNSACAVIGCEDAGCVPYLVDAQTGFIFKKGDKQALFEECKRMVSDIPYTLEKGLAAYNKIQNEWNGKVAARRLVELIDSIDHHKPMEFATGPCSPT